VINRIIFLLPEPMENCSFCKIEFANWTWSSTMSYICWRILIGSLVKIISNINKAQWNIFINSNQLTIQLITIIHNYLSEYMYLKWFVRLSSTITSISHANIFEFFFCFCTLIFWADINTNELIMIDAMVKTNSNDIFCWNGLNRFVSPIFVWQDDEIMVHLRLYLSPETIFMHTFKIFTTFLFDTIFHRLTS